MKKISTIFYICCILTVLGYPQTIYTDSAGDIDPGIANGNGTLDILGMEVSHTLTDFIFKLTVNGNILTTDWGNFMIGIATGSGSSTAVGNGWGRPINLDGTSSTDMNYWIGSWVNAPGGSQLWNYNGTGWNGPAAIAGYSFTSGATSTITYTVSYTSLGISTAPGTIYFDAYSSGGGGTDGAVDALSNPNVSITSWSESYTSNETYGLSSYGWTAFPVELTSFEASTVDDNALLIWETASEINNHGFEIEKAMINPGLENKFEKIGFVLGNGNSNSLKSYSFTDKGISSGKFAYRLKQIDNDGTFTYSSEVKIDNLKPTDFNLLQNYPNPFNPSTVIKYNIPVDAFVSLKVYDLLGNEVAVLVDAEQAAGNYDISFNARNLATGLYFYTIRAGDFTATKKMMLMK